MIKIFSAIILFIIISTLISQNVSAQATFTLKTDFTAGTNPSQTAIMDLNGDGKIDLVSVNKTSNTVSVFFNTTIPGVYTPTFSAKTDFTTGSAPSGVAFGDINGDGKPDIVVVNYSSNSVSVLLNTTTTGSAAPTFSAKTDFTTGNGPIGLVIGDINGDGKPDLSVANKNSGTVSVLLNTTTPGASTPTFTAETSFNTGSGPTTSVSLGDFNGDGKLDLAATAVGANGVSVLLNTTATGASAPAFSSANNFNTGFNPLSVSIGDINGDGKPDMAVLNQGLNTVSVLLNTTTTGAITPTFSTKTDFTTGNSPAAVIICDLNCDGKPDLSVTNQGENSVSVFLNTTTTGVSTPAFTAKKDFTTGTGPAILSIGDFNGDGKPDLSVPNSSTTSFSVLLNTMTLGVSTASFSAATSFVTGINPSILVTGDFNGDGKLDVATSNTGSNTFSVLLNNTTPGASTPAFLTKKEFAAGNNPYSITCGDLNGDGKPDVAVVNAGSNSISVFLNTTVPGAAIPAFTAKTDFTTGISPNSITLGDINGDGKQDLVAANFTGSSVSVFLNTTTSGALTPSFTTKTDFTILGNPASVRLADINGDGKPDLITANNNSENAAVFLNTTTPGALTPNFTTRTDLVTGTNPNCVAIGDLNGDGNPDIVTANSLGGNISVLINNTTPGSLTPDFYLHADFNLGIALLPYYIMIGDITGDGKPDLAAVNYDINTVSVARNLTTPGMPFVSLTSISDFNTGGTPTSGAMGDINGDGKRDLIVLNQSDGTVSVLLNTISPPLPVELASFTSSVTGNNVTLKWSTAHEENNSGFEIERNSFGEGWKKTGEVKGHGTTNITQNYAFSDKGLTTGLYKYRLKQIDYNGNNKYYELSEEIFIGIPNKFSLYQNYPNPFNPETRINYQLPARGFVSLKVYDLGGKEVASLVNEVKEAGYYSTAFNAKNLASGTYFCKLTTDKYSDVKKMVVVK